MVARPACRHLAAGLTALLAVQGCGDKAPGASPAASSSKPAAEARMALGPVTVPKLGVGSVKTPMGVFSNSGVEKYVLTPRDGC